MGRRQTACGTKSWRLLPALENERGVGAAKPKGIRQGVFKISRSRMVRHVVEITCRIGMRVINGGRQFLVAQSKRADSRFQPPGAAEQVSRHGLGRAYRELPRVFAEDALKRERFDGVAQRRGGAMCVDVRMTRYAPLPSSAGCVMWLASPDMP